MNIKRVLKYLRTAKTFDEMAMQLKMTPDEIYKVIMELQMQGHPIDVYTVEGAPTAQYNPTVEPPKMTYQLNSGTGKVTKLFMISDTHLASKWDNVPILEQIYEEAYKKGVNTILHAGDISEGYYRNRPNHVHELRAIGATDQAEYIINKYPKQDGIKTYYILGNHDHTHIKNGGTDIGKIISNERKDMACLGWDIADLVINKTKIRLYHPSGGPSYALSYKPQKYIEGIPGGEKPHMLGIGHYHGAIYMLHRNVHSYMIPGLQSPTPYVITKGLGGILGYWDIEFESDKDGNIVYNKGELRQYHNKPQHKTLTKRRR